VAPQGGGGPAPGVEFAKNGVINKRTGVGFDPSAIGGGHVEAALPPGVQHNSHPGLPAHPAHADVGTHAGIEGGGHADLLNAMHGTMQQLQKHLSRPRPALNIKRDEQGNMTRIEPEEQQ